MSTVQAEPHPSSNPKDMTQVATNRNNHEATAHQTHPAGVVQPTQENQPDNQTSAQSRIEKDVGSILAGLNQEQLASIVAAARASEARNQDDQYSTSADYDRSNLLAHLPPGLGQAASALTSFASSFKRNLNGASAADRPNEPSHDVPEKLQDAPPPPGTEYQAETLHHHQQHHHHHPQTPTEPPQDSQSKETDEPAAAAKAAHHASATAAAIASLGTLAAQHTNHNVHAHAAAAAAVAASGQSGTVPSNGHSPNSRGAKQSRGPELDRQRKDNHKEVERRRRSAINDGIGQLSQIVPGCDTKNTNKGSVIMSAVRYIQDLKHNEASNIEKWTLEKLLMDQAMNDLSTQLDQVRRENERLRAELGIEEPKPEEKSHYYATHPPSQEQPHAHSHVHHPNSTPAAAAATTAVASAAETDPQHHHAQEGQQQLAPSQPHDQDSHIDPQLSEKAGQAAKPLSSVTEPTKAIAAEPTDDSGKRSRDQMESDRHDQDGPQTPPSIDPQESEEDRAKRVKRE